MFNEAIVQNGTENHCLAVHYMVPIPEAIQHFQDCGFTGIRDMKVREKNKNCNDCRESVRDMANRGEGVYFFQGNYEWAITNGCHIYEFDFDSYIGGQKSSDPADNGFVGYIGE